MGAANSVIRRPLKSSLKRVKISVADDEKEFELWRFDSRFERASNPVLCCISIAALFWFATMVSSWPAKVILGGFIGLAFYHFVCGVNSLFKPLLLLNSREARVVGRVLLWAQLQKVEIEHRLGDWDDWGAYTGTRWTFFDLEGKRCARTTIPKDRCSQEREDEMIAFAAGRLGSEVPAVDRSGPL